MFPAIIDDLTNDPLLTKQDRYRLRHERKGLCKGCSRPAVTAKCYCLPCSLAQSRSSRRKPTNP